MESVQPLRISKPNTPSSSPGKMTSLTPSATSRPLAEIGSTERRRNSPSYNQATRKMIVSHEASPYTENSSPSSMLKSTPRGFWHDRDALSPAQYDAENSPEHSPSLGSSATHRRPSVERLAQASRVKNSNIFALESKDAYDPSTLPIVERPSANRLSQSVANNVFSRYDSLRKENNPYRAKQQQRLGHKRNDSDISASNMTPSKSPLSFSPGREGSPSSSPTKSSLARTSMFDNFPATAFDPESGTWSDGEEHASTPRTLRHHAKSVTFHEEPPVVNEYEQQTPEPSVSVASDREGSWDSDDFDDQDISFDRGSSVDRDREDSFDEDLENADKTPVVLPEDWTRMSPDEARTDLVDAEDDVFEDAGSKSHASPAASRVASDGESRPLPPLPGFRQKTMAESDILSNTAERAANARRMVPSPPKRSSCSKEEILSMTKQSNLTLEDRLKLMSGRETSSERPTSKSSHASAPAQEEELTITNLDTGEKMEVRVAEREVEGDDSVVDDLSEFANAPPRISRESILRKVRNSKYDFEDDSEDDDDEQVNTHQSAGRPTIAELAQMHPDDPIPSRETSRETSSSYTADPVGSVLREYADVKIKEEPIEEEGEFDMSSIPSADDYDRQSSVLRHEVQHDSESDEDASRESSMTPDAENSNAQTQQQQTEHPEEGKETLQDAMALLSVKDYSSAASTPPEPPKQAPNQFLGLPTYQSTDDYDFGMTKYITPSPPGSRGVSHTKLGDTKIPTFQQPVEGEHMLEESPGQSSTPTERGIAKSENEVTPTEREVSPAESTGSVIHNTDDLEPISPLDDEADFASEYIDESALEPDAAAEPGPEPVPVPEVFEQPVVPERQATIKTGGKLKARRSETQADLLAMAEQRRMVSAEYAEHPVPPIPAQFVAEAAHASQTSEPGAGPSPEDIEVSQYAQVNDAADAEVAPKHQNSRKGGASMDLSLDTSTFSIGEQDGLGLDQEFDRLIEAQKKGYLMRQNTKVVVATNRNFSGDSNDSNATAKNDTEAVQKPSTEGIAPSSRGGKSANSSPRKASGEQYLKTEPWNGKQRRKSVRHNSPQKHRSEPAPPLPGKESALNTVDEDFAAGNLEQDVPEGVERGRLFVKVASVKNLDLPMPKNDRIFFQLTLDNGLHCVTTADMELGRSAPIGQEFELVVLNDLEFQLTLSTKLPPAPKQNAHAPALSSSPTKAKPQKSSGISKLLSSPKKRAEKERLERQAAEAEERRQEEETRRKRASVQPTAWDMLRELVNAQDGSFARAYINLKAHEKSCFGRQLVVDIPCYNEWALEQDAQVVNSVRSKRGHNAGPIRRPPYVVGHLQLQLLYIPKPNGATDADMPKSMSSAIREMGKACDVKEVVHEGHLSQQGGDCSHWRRRFFRLQGAKLTAYHEHTHQKRAVINLSKASRLVDDRSTLLAAPSPAKPGSKGGRRKSAFAEEDEEGYQYVEEGFRIRFGNGETIDFYADSRGEKDVWMAALAQVVGKPDPGTRATRWTDLVLARERGSVAAPAAPSTTAAQPMDAPLTSALRQHGTDVKDFSSTTSGVVANPASIPPVPTAAPPVVPPRAEGRRKAVPTFSATAGSKSVPTSPVKSATAPRPTSSSGIPSTAAETGKTGSISAASNRSSGTPPLQQRKGHRTRDAVKSMIF